MPIYTVPKKATFDKDFNARYKLTDVENADKRNKSLRNELKIERAELRAELKALNGKISELHSLIDRYNAVDGRLHDIFKRKSPVEKAIEKDAILEEIEFIIVSIEIENIDPSKTVLGLITECSTTKDYSEKIIEKGSVVGTKVYSDTTEEVIQSIREDMESEHEINQTIISQASNRSDSKAKNSPASSMKEAYDKFRKCFQGETDENESKNDDKNKPSF